ncbi:MAG: leucyl aminopeptidase [Hyphomicrobiaceae bacterium]
MTKHASDRLDIVFADFAHALNPACVVLASDGVALGKTAADLDKRSGNGIQKAAKAAAFKAKSKANIEILAPQGLDVDRLLVLGTGKDATEQDWTLLGGAAVAAISSRKVKKASLIADVAATGDMKPAAIAAALAFGAQLRHYSFKKYLTKGAATANGSDDKEPADKDTLDTLVIHCADPAKAKAAYAYYQAVANGVHVARNLVNEPANALGPVEFAHEVEKLKKLGVEVEILEDKDLEKLGMGSLLCVSQGSARPARVCVMQWNGAKSKKARPIAFVGKGVVFDSGGISIKPASGMEDMKGDMGGAACVVGLMHALAEREANVNAVGLIGCVENMVSGSAVRPGDIVTSMSGQTIEVLNTDAEGRLVLADVLWYAQDRFKPRMIVDLATLTGAIMVSLGKEYAGLFSNDDKLAEELQAASTATGEKVWRMPLDKSFHKLIDSKNADVKNIGGRWGGACTAAAFLERFIQKDTAWAHLDIAGTAMDSTRNEISPSWASGWGVRLLDRLVADNYEKSEK